MAPKSDTRPLASGRVFVRSASLTYEFGTKYHSREAPTDSCIDFAIEDIINGASGAPGEEYEDEEFAHELPILSLREG